MSENENCKNVFGSLFGKIKIIRTYSVYIFKKLYFNNYIIIIYISNFTMFSK